VFSLKTVRAQINELVIRWFTPFFEQFFMFFNIRYRFFLHCARNKLRLFQWDVNFVIKRLASYLGVTLILCFVITVFSVPVFAKPDGGYEGQDSVIEYAPGDKEYRGGHWAVYVVTWIETPYLITNADDRWLAEGAGDLTIARHTELDVLCPVMPGSMWKGNSNPAE
jgi:hypothetical protein